MIRGLVPWGRAAVRSDELGRNNPDALFRPLNREGNISFDHDAYRFRPLLRPGWGRQGLLSGELGPQPGLTFAVSVLNGHHASSADQLGESFRTRVKRFIIGPGGERLWRRSLAHARKPRRTAWMLRRWWSQRSAPTQPGQPNLAVGFFAPGNLNPAYASAVFQVRGTDETNGQLEISGPEGAIPVVRGLGNIPLLLVAAYRNDGVALYAGTFPGTRGLPDATGFMRPLGVIECDSSQPFVAGLQQHSLGQIGFRVDSRVRTPRLANVEALGSAHGSAVLVDPLSHEPGAVDETPPVCWSEHGLIERGCEGSQGGADSFALRGMSEPAGLVRARIAANGPGSEASVLFRWQDAQNHWRLTRTSVSLQLARLQDGDLVMVEDVPCSGSPTDMVQLIDDGEQIVGACGAASFFVSDEFLGSSATVGFGIWRGTASIRSIEVHPRKIPVPPELSGPAWEVPVAGDALLVDQFSGGAGPLDEPGIGNVVWRRTLGQGRIERTGDGAATVHASPSAPNPGRTLYTTAWSNPTGCAVEVDIEPPGTGRGQGQMGRGGLVIWQDDHNYFIVNNWLDDGYGGASVSSFFCLDGYEDIYEAVWTNVGSRVAWGKRHRLAVAFDGDQFLVRVDGEPVLHRSLSDVRPDLAGFTVNRVGIVANWEWGDDTGSRFSNFVGRRLG